MRSVSNPSNFRRNAHFVHTTHTPSRPPKTSSTSIEARQSALTGKSGLSDSPRQGERRHHFPQIVERAHTRTVGHRGGPVVLGGVSFEWKQWRSWRWRRPRGPSDSRTLSVPGCTDMFQRFRSKRCFIRLEFSRINTTRSFT
jgi:hypothetical protein